MLSIPRKLTAGSVYHVLVSFFLFFSFSFSLHFLMLAMLTLYSVLSHFEWVRQRLEGVQGISEVLDIVSI